LPNQPILRNDRSGPVDEEADVTADEDTPTPPAASPAPLSPLLRFLNGLDEALERARLDARETRYGPRSDAGGAEKAILALDAVLAGWSTTLTILRGPGQAIVGDLTRIRMLAPTPFDAMARESTATAIGFPPREQSGPVGTNSHASKEWAEPATVALATSIGLATMSRVFGCDFPTSRHAGKPKRR
jgi:hypothetical protein